MRSISCMRQTMRVSGMSDFYTLEDLEWISVPEFTTIPTGNYYRGRNGKLKEERAGIEYIRTASAGKLPLETWYQHAFAVIRREGLDRALEEICGHVRNHCAWLHTDKEVERYSAKCLVNGTYQRWEDFGQEKRAVPTAMGTTPEQSGCADASTANSIVPNSASQIKGG